MFQGPHRLTRFVLITLAALSTTMACTTDDGGTPQPTELVSLGLEANEALSVELLADAELKVGLNAVYYRVKRLPGGELVTSAAITQTPIMHMEAMGMEHSCPCEQPPAVAEDGLFPGYVVFQMASGTGGSGDAWRNEITVDLGDGSGPASFVFADLAVAASGARKDLTVTDAMGGTSVAIVTLDFDDALVVGHNTFTVTVHQKADMAGMVWDPMADWTITATPDMPSMGHGSTDNIDPVHVSAGRFEGSVNLTMPGTWRLVLAFADEGHALGTVEYTLDL